MCLLSLHSILLDYDFNKLEDIWFTSASHLTMETIELLMDRLPELLSIGMAMRMAIQIICIYMPPCKRGSGLDCDDDNLNLHSPFFLLPSRHRAIDRLEHQQR